jgi:hypothetical protein
MTARLCMDLTDTEDKGSLTAYHQHGAVRLCINLTDNEDKGTLTAYHQHVVVTSPLGDQLVAAPECRYLSYMLNAWSILQSTCCRGLTDVNSVKVVG